MSYVKIAEICLNIAVPDFFGIWLNLPASVSFGLIYIILLG